MGNVQCGVVVFPGQEYVNILEATPTADSLCVWKQMPFELIQGERKQKKPMMKEEDGDEDSDEDFSVELIGSDDQEETKEQEQQQTNDSKTK